MTAKPSVQYQQRFEQIVHQSPKPSDSIVAVVANVAAVEP